MNCCIPYWSIVVASSDVVCSGIYVQVLVILIWCVYFLFLFLSLNLRKWVLS
jgi:hypothetical protein